MESAAGKKKRAAKIVEVLEGVYPDSLCTLDFAEPWQLLFSARLAAQCTDARVNIVSETLYAKYPDLESMAAADLDELMAIVRPTGFFRVKARDLKNAAAMLLTRFGGTVPREMDELLELPGVGRKVANLIRGDVYGLPAIVADTHCIRLSNRMGLCDSKNPHKVEIALSGLIAPEKQNNFCHRLVLHGRAVCSARSPRCGECAAAPHCERRGLI